MALDPNIILSGQQFDLMGAMNSGMAAAQNQNALTRQRQIEDLYRTQGNALMQGDTNALGMLAQFDPAAAQDMLANKQQMDFSAETMAMRREATRAATAEKLAAEAATLTAEQLAAEREALSGALQGGAFFYQNKDKAGYEAFLRSKGIDPAAYPFEAFPAHAADVEGVLDALDKFAPPEGPEWRPATPEEAAANGAVAGQINTKTGKFDAQNPPSGMVIETGPNGTTVRQGPGVAAADGTGINSGDALRTQITDAETMLGMIGEIAKDPALPKVTGALEGGGGNNVDEMNVIQRAYYGGDGLATIQKIAQLQGNAWLGARALLKGGGQITDYESKKAESAMARLSRAQGDAEFKAALKDLEDALREGVKKLQAAQGGTVTPDAPASGEATISSDAEYDALPSGAVFVGPDGVKRRKP